MSIIYICILNIKTRALCRLDLPYVKNVVPSPFTLFMESMPRHAAHQMAPTHMNFRNVDDFEFRRKPENGVYDCRMFKS